MGADNREVPEPMSELLAAAPRLGALVRAVDPGLLLPSCLGGRDPDPARVSAALRQASPAVVAAIAEELAVYAGTAGPAATRALDRLVAEVDVPAVVDVVPLHALSDRGLRVAFDRRVRTGRPLDDREAPAFERLELDHLCAALVEHPVGVGGGLAAVLAERVAAEQPEWAVPLLAHGAPAVRVEVLRRLGEIATIDAADAIDAWCDDPALRRRMWWALLSTPDVLDAGAARWLVRNAFVAGADPGAPWWEAGPTTADAARVLARNDATRRRALHGPLAPSTLRRLVGRVPAPLLVAVARRDDADDALVLRCFRRARRLGPSGDPAGAAAAAEIAQLALTRPLEASARARTELLRARADWVVSGWLWGALDAGPALDARTIATVTAERDPVHLGDAVLAGAGLGTEAPPLPVTAHTCPGLVRAWRRAVAHVRGAHDGRTEALDAVATALVDALGADPVAWAAAERAFERHHGSVDELVGAARRSTRRPARRSARRDRRAVPASVDRAA